MNKKKCNTEKKKTKVNVMSKKKKKVQKAEKRWRKIEGWK